ncbi:hypothetical protein [Corallococcus sicarius]|uniref:Uncharacterized protein n=1 Tax=Corallococcus sicarius TaxID=2316726 RepID=A0A3A8N3X6_9BACT|nr:hypothetical protein [Corallococcus sicarius]RKH38230.1 hypothetical protein D7X12_26935 [Corallococcus sicarius]
MEEDSHETGTETISTERAALTTRTVVLTPTADAHVEAASPNASFGASSTLKVSRTPEALTARFSNVASVGVLPDQRIAFTGNFNGYLSFAGQSYVSREPEEYDGARDALVGVLTAAGGDVALRQFAPWGSRPCMISTSRPRRMASW